MDVPNDLGELLPVSRSLKLCPDPLALFRILTTSDDGEALAPALLFESADSDGVNGERSFLIPRAALRVRARGLNVEITALSPQGKRVLPWLSRQWPGATLKAASLRLSFPAINHQQRDLERLHSNSPVNVLRVLSRAWKLSSQPAPMSFLIAGCFSYDLLGLYENLPAQEPGDYETPDFEFWVPEELLVLDHSKNTTRLFTYVFGGDGAEASYNDASQRIEALSKVCERAMTIPATCLDIEPGEPAEVDTSDAEFAARVERLKAHILAGDIYQIVLSRSFTAPCPDPLGAYARLRKLNPSPYMFFLRGEQSTLFGASPETAVKVTTDPRRLIIKPIAGTRPRGRDPKAGLDPELDTRLELELRLNEKEVAEHIMLVDLARNDVARVSKPGTRVVDTLLSVERYSHVMHLVSSVSGELREDFDALHAYVATMNMGTLVGAPKIKAATLLRKQERKPRGAYGGAVGYLTHDGAMDTSIVIRSAQVYQGQAHVRAGAGVVYDSDPRAEADETRRKAAAVLKALGAS